MSNASPLTHLKETKIWIVKDEICLRPFRVSVITPAYIDWMNDEEITQFTEQRFSLTTFENTKAFIKAMEVSTKTLYFGIFAKETHIGSIKLGNINHHHRTADISYLIGVKNYWGKGIASKAFQAMKVIGFAQLGLAKIIAGVYAINKGSIRALEKNGFVCEGIKRLQFVIKEQCVDGLIYGKLRPE